MAAGPTQQGKPEFRRVQAKRNEGARPEYSGRHNPMPYRQSTPGPDPCQCISTAEVVIHLHRRQDEYATAELNASQWDGWCLRDHPGTSGRMRRPASTAEHGSTHQATLTTAPGRLHAGAREPQFQPGVSPLRPGRTRLRLTAAVRRPIGQGPTGTRRGSNSPLPAVVEADMVVEGP